MKKTLIFTVCVFLFILLLWQLNIFIYTTHSIREGILKPFQDNNGFWTCKNLKFSKKKLPITGLASVPGSGNTWIRHLLQQATGKWVELNIP